MNKIVRRFSSTSAAARGPRGLSPGSARATHSKSKYGSVKVRTDEGVFDSKREYACWLELKAKQSQGLITHLERQKTFTIDHEGVRICRWTADFVFFEGGVRVVADAKGYRTPVYRLKKKLMQAFFKVEIREM